MYKVEISNQGGMKFDVKSKDYKFTVDVKGEGITPPDTLLASLGSCIGVYLRKYLDGAKISLANFTIDVEGELSREPPVSFKDIKITINTPGLNLDEHRREAMINFIHNCPIHNTLKVNPNIAIEVL